MVTGKFVHGKSRFQQEISGKFCHPFRLCRSGKFLKNVSTWRTGPGRRARSRGVLVHAADGRRSLLSRGESVNQAMCNWELAEDLGLHLCYHLVFLIQQRIPTMSLSYEKLYSIFGLVFSCSRLSHRVVVWGQERLQLGCSLQTTNRKRKIQLVGRAVSYHEPVTC